LVAFIAWPTSALNALSLPARYFLDRLRVRGEHLVDDPFEFAGVAHLLQALCLDQRIDVGAVAAPQRIEDLAGTVVGDRAVRDAPDQRGQGPRPHRRRSDPIASLFSRRDTSPISQLAASLACPLAVAASSKYAANALLCVIIAAS